MASEHAILGLTADFPSKKRISWKQARMLKIITSGPRDFFVAVVTKDFEGAIVGIVKLKAMMLTGAAKNVAETTFIEDPRSPYDYKLRSIYPKLTDFPPPEV